MISNLALSTAKERVAETMDEVMSSGRDAYLKLPGGSVIYMEFEMLESKGRPIPVCNIFLVTEDGEIDRVLYEKNQEGEKIITTGSLEAVLALCGSEPERKHFCDGIL